MVAGPMSTKGTRTMRFLSRKRTLLIAPSRLPFLRHLVPNMSAMTDTFTEPPKTSLLVCIKPISGDPVPSSRRSFFPNWVALTFRNRRWGEARRDGKREVIHIRHQRRIRWRPQLVGVVH
jgi:hypothetical protein